MDQPAVAARDFTAQRPAMAGLAFLLGAWICGTVFMAGVAGGNFGRVDPARHPRLDEVFAALSPQERVPALRFVASEMNRRYFEIWNYAQLALAIAVVLVLLRGRLARRIGPWPLITAAIMASIVLYLALWVTPHMIEAGRAIDFLDRSQEHEAISRFRRQHGFYMGMDSVKLLLAIGLSIWAILPRRSRA